MKTKLFFWIIFILISGVIISCVDNFEAPEWNIELNVPLMNDTFLVSDLEDGENIFIENGDFKFKHNGEINSYSVGTIMNINSKGESEYDYFPILPNVSVSDSINIEDIQQNERFDVSYGKVEEWILRFNIQNNSGVLDKVILGFGEIFRPDGTPLTIEINSSDFPDFAIDLSRIDDQYFVIGDKTGSTLITDLHFSIESVYNSFPTQLDMVKVYFLDHIYFDEMVGVINNKEIVVSDFEKNIDIDYPQGLGDAIELKNTELTFNIWNKIGFDVLLTGKLTAINEEKNTEYTIDLNSNYNNTGFLFNAAPAIGDSAFSSNSLLKTDVDSLMKILPSKISFTEGKFLVRNQTSLTGFAYSKANAYGSYNVDVPFTFEINNEKISPDTIFSVEISRDNQDNIEEYAQDGRITLTVDNELPLGVNVIIKFSANKDLVYSQPSLEFPQNSNNLLYIQAETVDNEIILELSKDDLINNFTNVPNDELFMGLEFELDASNGEIEIKPEQVIKIIGSLSTTINTKR